MLHMQSVVVPWDRAAGSPVVYAVCTDKHKLSVFESLPQYDGIGNIAIEEPCCSICTAFTSARQRSSPGCRSFGHMLAGGASKERSLACKDAPAQKTKGLSSLGCCATC